MGIILTIKAIIYKRIVMHFGNTFLIPFFAKSKVILYSHEHSGSTPPHTISIVKQGSNYLGYVGPQGNGNIDLFFSSDLIHWKPYEKNPVIKEIGCRWPSVLKVGKYIFMVHDTNFCTDKPTNIVLKRANLSTPYKFEFLKQITKETQSVRNRYNSYLFFDPKNKQYCLYYHTNSGSDKILVKVAKKLTDLDKAKENVVYSRNFKGDETGRKGLAAPSMMYLDGNYILQVEAQIGYKWVIELFVSKYPDKGFKVVKQLLLKDDQACPFPYVEGEKIYNFIGERGGIRILDSAGIEALWNPWFLGLVTYKKKDLLKIVGKLANNFQ